MPSSDSEGFESADEGLNIVTIDEKTKCSLSSDCSGKALGSSKVKNKLENDSKQSDGWDDFDIEEIETPVESDKNQKTNATKMDTNISEPKVVIKSEDTGWDDFGDDWDQSESKQSKLESEAKMERDVKEVTEQLSAASTKSAGWGWVWGVDSLLNSATAGLTTITNQVSQGISTVLENSIGAPDPEVLAKERLRVEREASNIKSETSQQSDVKPSDDNSEENKSDQTPVSDATFPFGGLISGVTKFVETTGTKVLSSGLDTLETIGKKTMEVLQDGDPGLVKKRAMLGLDTGDKPILSQVLREAKAKADEEDRIREERREAKEIHYENLFDDYDGLVHLEALEMLSRQVTMRIEERLRATNPEKRQEIKETLQQVSELCEMPEEEDEDEEQEATSDVPRDERLLERLQTATQDLGLKLHFQPIVKQYTEIIQWCAVEDAILTEKAIYKRGVCCLAQATALSMELYHKAAEMLLVKSRRSTVDESDALTQMTVVLTKHIGELATHFTDKLNSLSMKNKEQINNYITNIFLEAGKSSTYVQNAFQLAIPILQIGAV